MENMEAKMSKEPKLRDDKNELSQTESVLCDVIDVCGRPCDILWHDVLDVIDMCNLDTRKIKSEPRKYLRSHVRELLLFEKQDALYHENRKAYLENDLKTRASLNSAAKINKSDNKSLNDNVFDNPDGNDSLQGVGRPLTVSSSGYEYGAFAVNIGGAMDTLEEHSKRLFARFKEEKKARLNLLYDDNLEKVNEYLQSRTPLLIQSVRILCYACRILSAI